MKYFPDQGTQADDSDADSLHIFIIFIIVFHFIIFNFVFFRTQPRSFIRSEAGTLLVVRFTLAALILCRDCILLRPFVLLVFNSLHGIPLSHRQDHFASFAPVVITDNAILGHEVD